MKFVSPSGRFLSCGSLLVGLTIVVAAGCKPQDQIATYSTPKPESIETPIAGPNPAAMPPRMGSRPTSPAAGKPEVKFAKPEGWQESAGTPFSVAAFEVVDGDQRIETTVSPTGGDLLANMNRWRDQVGLPHFTSEEMEKAFESREVNGLPAKFIEMHSPDGAPKKDSILGVVVEDGDRTWFVKLRGSTELAKREREKFDAFANSLKW
jgi:hypothetical protein